MGDEAHACTGAQCASTWGKIGDSRVKVALTTSRHPHKQPKDHLSTGDGAERGCTSSDLEAT